MTGTLPTWPESPTTDVFNNVRYVCEVVEWSGSDGGAVIQSGVDDIGTIFGVVHVVGPGPEDVIVSRWTEIEIE